MSKATSNNFFPNEVHGEKSKNLKEIRQGPRGGKGTADRAKKEVLRLLADGYKINDALTAVGRSRKAYDYWRKIDPEFREEADRIRGRRFRKDEGPKEVPDFEEFCEEYLGHKLFRHQLQWYDILEGREPRDLTDAQTYTLGSEPNLLICNTPPNHAKSTTITVFYTLWRILKDPNTQVVIISKKEAMAKKFLFQIKDLLVSRSYQKLQDDFGPAEGFEKTSPIWSSTQIYFGPELRDVNAKDPTVEAVGLGGTIYGARADLIILDDVIATDNAHDFENQIDWITRMVLTRPTEHGRVLVVGTRVAPVDLYGELMSPSRYEDERAPWTYFAQPAVERFAEDPKDWVTLWPRSNMSKRGAATTPDEDGLFPAWDGPALAKMRERLKTNPNAWSQGYQQLSVSEDSIFKREKVYAAVNGMRKVGPLYAGHVGHPPDGMDGKAVIAGLDPASSGFTAAVVVAMDRRTGKRWLLDAYNKPNTTPDQIRDLLVGWARRYGVTEWRVEKVLLSNWILQDQQLIRDLANMGCSMREHITNASTKWDEDGGILSLTSLFDGDRPLLDIPSTQYEVIRTMCEQFVTYQPKTKNPTDLIMALWFVEARLRQLVLQSEGSMFVNSAWTTQEQLNDQMVVDFSQIDGQLEEIYIPNRWGSSWTYSKITAT
ncbi:hypothetical protein EF847_01560 [Actinobacteria bacterium YIM 96077]|uniref:Terminase large subunit gp17-like C-terminal domain-containing protein n=1 Tax=Phytoactinopolyspora halophila TaxID=1981511 RepID=A0A329QFQ2_9ACTN|nr:hypothetical protein [Phytoactinopolyspora halophila]AYY11608.1 hypothetical protein EF847_01560 [Actinobacteria bacterium YIM 96077]RAW11154.1 hypothetical protein DPM12_17585 [Phytoactinopolyspora halophila]